LTPTSILIYDKGLLERTFASSLSEDTGFITVQVVLNGSLDNLSLPEEMIYELLFS
jgi:hypothetical protein